MESVMFPQPLWRLLLSAALIALFGPAASGQDLPQASVKYYVNPDASNPYQIGGGGGDGLSWEEGFVDLVEFLIEFPVLRDNQLPDTVFRVDVAEGTYHGWAPNPFDEDAAFMIPDNLYIYGG